MSAPYSAAITRDIHQTADRVEATLHETGMQLTMGGEPTFIPLVPEGAEWSTAAFGPTKLGYARRFARQLIADTYPGAVMLETSGKHYPGEPIPRWTLLLQRRADGLPAWKDPSLLKGDLTPGTHKLAQAKQLIIALAGNLGLPSAAVLPLAAEASPKRAVGYVLPLDYDTETSAWRTDTWREDFPAGPIPLFWGDSLAGLRLPLGKLAKDRLRRALTVELREGSITIFVPPLVTDSYLLLLGHIEATIAAAGLSACVLGGYAPPPDGRLPTVGFASDPGVLEINIAACANWKDYDTQMHALYAAAEKTGLCARKLGFNGRESGTGGGAHLVFGGPPELLSPFFAFPAFLPSIIRYFQHHPALSYVFTGQYVGPSSQAPRIDESTFEALYELEIACAGAEQFGSPANLALFDLLFRDLLMDRSGNTHRAEISVDKLWNPFAGNGRLGLVELRAFETHPAPAAMSVIALFIRAIFARLAKAPFTTPFKRWHGELHDRFFLPAFLKEDLEAICADLADHGIPFDADWLTPIWEWRCPAVGHLELPDKTGRIQFRQAIEAWPLLGESPNAGTVARTVDASMDRLEASVSDPALLEKGLLLVNGYPCEFRSAGAAGAAAGIRYRAFYLQPALHPHVPAHAPLLIEWVDRETLCVTAAARWHVWNPAGDSYDTRPADEAEARERAAQRWQPWTRTVGQSRFIPKIDFPPEGRHTLDLRRYPAQSRA